MSLSHTSLSSRKISESSINIDSYLSLPLDESSSKEHQEYDHEYDIKNNKILIILFMLMLIIGTLTRIFSKLLTLPLYNYPIESNFILSAINLSFYICYFIPLFYYGNPLTLEERSISPWSFAIMGGLDSIASLMQGFSFVYITSGALLVLLQQAAIPISMLVSKIWLKTKYKWFNYAGSLTVIAGLIIVLMPKFLDPSQNEGNSTASTQLIWTCVLVASCFPESISAIYKEKVLAEHKMNVMFLNGGIGAFQIVFTVIFSIPSIYTLPHMTIYDLPSNIIGGFKCVGGINSILEDVVDAAGKVIIPKDDCSLAPFYYFTSVALVICFSILYASILKYGSTNILFLALTAIIPLADIAFSFNFMPVHEVFTAYSIVGLIVILVGLIIYRFTPSLLYKIVHFHD